MSLEADSGQLMSTEHLQTLEDFVVFYEAIPDDKWCVGLFHLDDNPTICCALGHLGRTAFEFTDSSTRLLMLLSDVWGVTCPSLSHVNDGKHEIFTGSTPKVRVLSFLKESIARRNAGFPRMTYKDVIG